MNMMRCQIKILDKDLTDLVHELSTQIVSQVVVISKKQIGDMKLYPEVFGICREALKKYVHAYYACGCSPNCDLGAQPTEFRNATTPQQNLANINFRSPRIHRYTLLLDVPLREFAKGLQMKLLKSVAKNSNVKNWHGLLFPVIRKTVETILGKYVYYSPECGYLCEVGACTEFDPWERVSPKEIG